jgi:hypothetical protein
LIDSGLALPYADDQITASVEAMLQGMPDFRIEPVRYRLRHQSIFIETKNSGALKGKKASPTVASEALQFVRTDLLNRPRIEIPEPSFNNIGRSTSHFHVDAA